MKNSIKRDIFVILFSTVLAVVVLILAGADSGKEKQYMSYTVVNGDTLYSIATKLEVDNWRKWVYETCENNGIEQGGMIYPGQEILIELN